MESLLHDGHQVVLHARSADRAETIGEFGARSAGIVVGDLRSATEPRGVADQVNAIGRMDAVITRVFTASEAAARPLKVMPALSP